MGKFQGLVSVMVLLFLIHEVSLKLHFAMAARELPSSVMAAVDDRRLVNIIQTDRTKPPAPPTPKPNGRPHVEPVRPSPPPLSPPPSS
nr:hypothetical protein Iba_chr05dCG14380 [Ipomoea batatas]GME21621.1 hypothetical protein Iba_scaffold28595CG0010 [Ipomoea batatas]